MSLTFCGLKYAVLLDVKPENFEVRTGLVIAHTEQVCYINLIPFAQKYLP